MEYHHSIIAQPARRDREGFGRLTTPSMGITLSATIPEDADGSSGKDAVIAEWTVHLLRTQPRKVWGVAAGIAAAAILGWTAFDGWVGAVLGGALVLSAVAEFLLPIRYRLTTDQAMCSYGLARLSLPWSSVRRIIEHADSIRLSPFRRPSRLDAFRGVELRFGPAASAGDRDRVMSIVRRLAPDAFGHTYADRDPDAKEEADVG